MLFESSRYLNTPLYTRKGEVDILQLRRRYKFDLTDATYYTFTELDTVSGVAYKLYGNAQLYWAIMDANPLYLSELDVKNGDTLIIPPLNEVLRVSG